MIILIISSPVIPFSPSPDIFELGKKRLFERDRALLFSLKER